MSRPDQLLLVGVVYTWGWLVAVVASGRFRPVDWLAGLLAALALPVY